jgi:predicted dehydrogenase
MIRVGLVGAGPWAGLFTAPMLASASGLSLAVVWARRPASAEALAHQHGAAAVDSFDDLLAACDAVAFTVPADVQAPLAVTAARAGKHLLLEKPVGFTVADARAVADAADDAGVATQLMLTYRFTGQVRDFLRSTAGAPLRYLRTAMLGGGALGGSPFATPWRQAAGAVLFDLGPHTLDLAEAAAGPIVELRAAEAGGVVTVATMHDSGASGHVAISGTTPGAAGRLDAEAVTDAGHVVLADPTPYEPAEVQRAIADEFARAVRGEFRQPLDVHRGVRLQRLIAAVAESIDTGGGVSVSGSGPASTEPSRLT